MCSNAFIGVTVFIVKEWTSVTLLEIGIVYLLLAEKNLTFSNASDA